jgi:hypothetical protein
MHGRRSLHRTQDRTQYRTLSGALHKHHDAQSLRERVLWHLQRKLQRSSPRAIHAANLPHPPHHRDVLQPLAAIFAAQHLHVPYLSQLPRSANRTQLGIANTQTL